MTRRREKLIEMYENGGPMWVCGVIDIDGVITGRVVSQGDSGIHTPEERLAGTCWRWNVYGQDWGDTRQSLGGKHMTPEENRYVRYWLEKEGWLTPEDDE